MIVQITFSLTNQISTYQIQNVESSFRFVFFSLWLKREKTEHSVNIIKVACT